MISNITKFTNFTPTKIKTAFAAGGLVLASSLLAKKTITPSDETLNYMDKSPSAVSSRAVLYNESPGGLKEGESLEEFRARLERGSEVTISESDEEISFSDIEENLPVKIEDDKTFYKELQKFKNPYIIKVLKFLYNSDVLYNKEVEMLFDAEVSSRSIKDTKVLSELNKIYKEILEIPAEELDPELPGMEANKIELALKIIDAYNIARGNYVGYRQITNALLGFADVEICKTNEYLNLHDSVLDEDETPLRDELKEHIWEGKARSQQVEEFMLAQKMEILVNLLESQHIDQEFKEYLYNVFLKNSELPTSAKRLCKDFYKKYDIMVFPSALSMDMFDDFDYMSQEMDAWLEAGGEKAMLPKIIVLNSIEPKYLGNILGSDSLFTNLVRLDGRSHNLIRKAIRHEIMHENDKLKSHFSYVGEERAQILKEIMPTKTVIGKDGKKHIVRDYEKCKYTEEFLNAGIEPNHIYYAYKNRAEFLAVAAEGDMSRYSQEFKDVLLKLGMPEYVFNLRVLNPEIEQNLHLMDIVKEQNPEVTDFSELIKLRREAQKAQAKRAAKMLAKIFSAAGIDDLFGD